MFAYRHQSRANRFNGKLPPALSPSIVPNKELIDELWLPGMRRRNRADRFAGPKRIGRGPSYRKGSQFDYGDRHRRPLDRNDRARVMVCAEALERRTKKKHKRDGVIGQSGLAVLRCFVNHFQDKKSGRLDPGYDDIQKKTGFCRETISAALKNLERAGILEVMRRIVRERVRVWMEDAQQFFAYDRVVQTTNAYMVNFPLPDRKTFGDLAAPLLRPERYRPSESRFSTESTADLSGNDIKPQKALDPALASALNRYGKTLGITS
jgi:hypothetical protein